MNQCDGCIRQLPVLGMDHKGLYRNPPDNVSHYHRVSEGLDGVMQCTKEVYNALGMGEVVVTVE